jgi:hypothetical protein
MSGPFPHIVSATAAEPSPNADNCNGLLSGDESISLEQVELEILLAMKIEDGLSFKNAVCSAMAQTGNEYLFSFPAERFPLKCKKVACIRLHEKDAITTRYLYQQKKGDSIDIADPVTLEGEFQSFADSFVGVMEQMRELFEPDASGSAH